MKCHFTSAQVSKKYKMADTEGELRERKGLSLLVWNPMEYVGKCNVGLNVWCNCRSPFGPCISSASQLC